MQRNLVQWLRQGVSPRRLALTLALGFAIGCIPVVGLPTVLCVALAFGLRLNLPAIQAANYAAMPFQLALIVPFVRLGARLFSASGQAAAAPAALSQLSSMHLFLSVGTLAGHALVAWFLIAGPAVVLMTVTLTAMLQRIPTLAAADSGD
jgi:uncharacterized protein (DUF2062 family)